MIEIDKKNLSRSWLKVSCVPISWVVLMATVMFFMTNKDQLLGESFFTFDVIHVEYFILLAVYEMLVSEMKFFNKVIPVIILGIIACNDIETTFNHFAITSLFAVAGSYMSILLYKLNNNSINPFYMSSDDYDKDD
jgi:hypothetical protein